MRRVVAENPGEIFYAAGLYAVYRETGRTLGLPAAAVNSEQALRQDHAADAESVRWSPADWGYDLTADLEERLAPWQPALDAEMERAGDRGGDAAERRYLRTLVQACRQARTGLRSAGVTPRDFVVIVDDAEHYETLLRGCLSASELRRYFPELDAATVAWARLAELPEAERFAVLASRLDDHADPTGGEAAAQALVAGGSAALPALLPLLREPGRAWQAAKLIADIGVASDEVVGALSVSLAALPAGGSDQSWAAAALGLLGRRDVVLAAAELPPQAVVSAVALPYTAFRDEGAHPLPLDYRPLEEILSTRPDLAPAIAERLAPGTSPCRISAAEVEVVLGGLGSPEPVVRRHALSVLDERPAALRRGWTAVERLAREDADPIVRRLAVLALSRRRRDATRAAEVVRAALTDTDPSVRAAADAVLREWGLPNRPGDR